jgi:hypothetical protein
MKIKILAATLISFLTAVGVHAADPKIDATIASAVRDPKNAPLIVAIAAGENPKSIAALVSAAVAALPDQTVEMVGAVLEVAPKQRSEILRAAILGQPKLSVEIATIALAMFPDQSAEIMKTAIEFAPENLRGSIAVLGNRVTFFDSAGRPTRPGRGSFPAQPIRPDLVSPSR